MARQSKASRGKFRWLGLRINHGELSRGSTSKIIAENLPDIDFKLFDSISSELDTLAIIRLKLEYNDYAREKLVQALKKLGFSDEQAYSKIMRYQSETQELYRSFQVEFDQNKAIYDWKGRKKLEETSLNLNENI